MFLILQCINSISSKKSFFVKYVKKPSSIIFLLFCSIAAF